jgi:protein disulfide-isomerase
MMIAIPRFLLLLALGASVAVAAESPWLTDFEQAKKVAKEENKAILIDFTGSDWCGWCMKLHEEVFSKKKFLEFAKKNFVLLELDFPSKKEIPEDLKKQNKELAKKYNVEGFPTVVLTDAKGRKFAQTGYVEGGPDAYVKHLEELLEKKDLD